MDSPIKESPHHSLPELPGPPDNRPRWRKAWDLTALHVKHTGVGVVCAVAYFDPGNWSTDMQAGSEFGYRLLFVVLLSGLFAVFLQILACRLGCVTGLDLAGHSRLLLYNRGKYPKLIRWLTLYPLYAIAEIAIIATDLAELLGSAIALVLLFPKLELWHGVLITAIDVFVVLLMGDPLSKRPSRPFEIFIAFMVVAVLICMSIITSQIGVLWGYTFQGYLPSKYVFSSGGLYAAIGIIGATVMPHSLFLGSALATQDRINMKPLGDEEFSKAANRTNSSLVPQSAPQRMIADMQTSIGNFFKAPPASGHATEVTRHSEHENNTYDFVRAHVYHGMIDMTISLLGFAVVINSMILILASTVFFYGDGRGHEGPAGLFDAYDLIKTYIGKAAAVLFAIALLASGQSASFVATLAGQAVAEGFIRWRVSAVMTRLLTRSLAMIPSMIVAIAMGREGVDALLVASQVVLSIVLPFVTFPLLYCTSSKTIMRCKKTPKDGDINDPECSEEWVYFNNNMLMMIIGWSIWLLIVIANTYVLISMAMDAS